MNKEVKRNTFTILESPLIGTRFTLGLAELIWAISLFWAGDTFERKTYSSMAAVMPENVWGCIFLVSAIIQWTLLMRFNFNSRFSVIFAGFNMLLWFFVVVSMYMAVYPPPAGISGELALAFAAMWIFIKSGVCHTNPKTYHPKPCEVSCTKKKNNIIPCNLN